MEGHDKKITNLQNALNTGGPALWAIFGLSVVLTTLTLWKLWHFLRLGIWSKSASNRAVAQWVIGQPQNAITGAEHARDLRSRVLVQAMQALQNPQFTPDMAKDDCARVANVLLSQSRQGLRAIDLIVTIAPLVGLLGTVLGMIDAFQALQESGAQADPAALAGGIWEALLTTAAGMGVAIPASVILSWFDGTLDKVQIDIENQATQILLHKHA